MKTIKLLTGENILTSRDLLKVVLENPQQQGANVAQIRQRIRILDALEGAKGDTLTLEDADYAFLSSTVNAFTFAVSTKRMLEVIEAALNPLEEDKP